MPVHEVVRLLLAEMGVTAPPIPVQRTAAYLGLRVVSLNPRFLASCGLTGQEAARIAVAVDGIWVPHAEGGTIAINMARSPRRRRFTIAHEVSHYLFARSTDRIGFSLRDGLAGDPCLEERMNSDAAELLMPLDMVTQEWSKWEATRADGFVPKFSDLCSTFDVSKRAMSLRLKELPRR